VICMIISRIFYMIGDFFLTGYDYTRYTYFPAVILWKLGSTILTVGIIIYLLTVDKVILRNKFKGIFAYIAIIITFIAIIYPIRPGFTGDFDTVAMLVMIAQNQIFFLVFLSLWFILVCPGLRKLTVSLFFGFTLPIIGTLLTAFNFSEPILENFGGLVLNIYLTIAVSLKITGYLLLTHVLLNFSKINKSLIDYYTSKQICIVHRGKIKGRAFMCANCHVLYCIKCKNAIAGIENECWNCKQKLDVALQDSVKEVSPPPPVQDEDNGPVTIDDLDDAGNFKEKKLHKN
jgi:hypothetical protein